MSMNVSYCIKSSSLGALIECFCFGGKGGGGGEGEATNTIGHKSSRGVAAVLVVTGDEAGGSEEQSVSVLRTEVGEQNRCDTKEYKTKGRTKMKTEKTNPRMRPCDVLEVDMVFGLKVDVKCRWIIDCDDEVAGVVVYGLCKAGYLDGYEEELAGNRNDV